MYRRKYKQRGMTGQMITYDQLQAGLPRRPAPWLITGVAGFIGSNLLETLLKLGQRVVGLDRPYRNSVRSYLI